MAMRSTVLSGLQTYFGSADLDVTEWLMRKGDPIRDSFLSLIPREIMTRSVLYTEAGLDHCDLFNADSGIDGFKRVGPENCVFWAPLHILCDGVALCALSLNRDDWSVLPPQIALLLGIPPSVSVTSARMAMKPEAYAHFSVLHLSDGSAILFRAFVPANTNQLTQQLVLFQNRTSSDDFSAMVTIRDSNTCKFCIARGVQCTCTHSMLKRNIIMPREKVHPDWGMFISRMCDSYALRPLSESVLDLKTGPKAAVVPLKSHIKNTSCYIGLRRDHALGAMKPWIISLAERLSQRNWDPYADREINAKLQLRLTCRTPGSSLERTGSPRPGCKRRASELEASKLFQRKASNRDVSSSREGQKRTPKAVPQHLCEVCGKTFSRASHAKEHIASVHQRIRFQCELCPKTFSLKSNLKKHMGFVHVNPTKRPFSCSRCEHAFKAKSALIAHETKVHGRSFQAGMHV
mmetsp:Transcript_17070/g.37128  ORF Transcript_17070/g.37128 Transcript_17070/m.37128 type:complete len:462 (-) Transcript_17070:1071-2456(-)